MKKKRIVIAGGGYGGIKAAETLLNSNRDDFELILIDKHPYHYLQPDVYDYIANKISLTDITISLVTFVASYNGRIQLELAEITSFDLPNRFINTTNGQIAYDYLIIALGSRTLFPKSIPGIFEYAHGIKRIHWPFNFKQRFEQMIYNKIDEEGNCYSTKVDFNIVVAGGGLSGVEVAAAMADYATQFFKTSGYICGGIKVTLIAGTKGVLAGLDEYLIDAAKRRLDQLGVKVLSGVQVSKVEENRVYLSNGSSLDMNYMIWTGGIIAAPVLETVEAKKEGQNYLVVDDRLRVDGYENVFAIGDCAIIKDVNGNNMPPTAQTAERSGIECAKNILLHLDDREMKSVKLKFDGVLVALGGKYAAAHLLGKFKFSGYLAYVVKSAISVHYKSSLVKRCKKGAKIIESN